MIEKKIFLKYLLYSFEINFQSNLFFHLAILMNKTVFMKQNLGVLLENSEALLTHLVERIIRNSSLLGIVDLISLQGHASCKIRPFVSCCVLMSAPAEISCGEEGPNGA